MCTSSAASHDPCLLEGLLWSREDEDHHDWIVDCNATREPNEDDVFKMIPRETGAQDDVDKEKDAMPGSNDERVVMLTEEENFLYLLPRSNHYQG